MKTCYYLMLIVCASAFLSCEEMISEEDISSEAVVLTAPADAAEFTETGLILSWEPVADADVYQLQIATPSFETALQIVRDSVMTGTHFSVSLSPNDYQWRVKAVNSGYETGFTTRSFTINE